MDPYGTNRNRWGLLYLLLQWSVFVVGGRTNFLPLLIGWLDANVTARQTVLMSSHRIKFDRHKPISAHMGIKGIQADRWLIKVL